MTATIRHNPRLTAHIAGTGTAAWRHPPSLYARRLGEP